MISNKNIPYYFAAVVIFVLLKFGFTKLDVNDLKFLLSPVNTLFGLLSGLGSVFLDGKGYYYESHNILIDKSCSGFNFLLLSFLVFTYPVIKYTTRTLHKVFAIPLLLITAYCFTVFVNTSRIFTSVVVQNQMRFLGQNQQDLIHEAIGIIINLSFLVLAYYLLNKKLQKREYNE